LAAIFDFKENNPGCTRSIQKGGDKMNRIVTGIAISLLLLGSVSVFAGQNDVPGGRRGQMGPPTEAYEACKDKSEGDSVEITTPRGETLKAVCKQINGKLAAMPEGGLRGPQAEPSGGETGNSQ
jgi:hypothetical protein